MVQIRELLSESTSPAAGLLLAESRAGGRLSRKDARLSDARLWIGGHIVSALKYIATSLSVYEVPLKPAERRTLQGLSLSQLNFAVAQASQASSARSLVRLVEVLPSASSFSWTAWCRCKTSLDAVSGAAMGCS
jgi:hypothetical protein